MSNASSIPIRQAAVDYLARVLSAISVDAGYLTNLGLSVWSDEPEFSPESAQTEALRTLIRDGAMTRRAARQYTMSIDLIGRVYADPQSADLPRALARRWEDDILYAIGRIAQMDDADYPIGVEDIRYTGSDIPEREPADNWLYPTVSIQIDFTHSAAP